MKEDAALLSGSGAGSVAHMQGGEGVRGVMMMRAEAACSARGSDCLITTSSVQELQVMMSLQDQRRHCLEMLGLQEKRRHCLEMLRLEDQRRRRLKMLSLEDQRRPRFKMLSLQCRLRPKMMSLEDQRRCCLKMSLEDQCRCLKVLRQ